MSLTQVNRNSIDRNRNPIDKTLRIYLNMQKNRLFTRTTENNIKIYISHPLEWYLLLISSKEWHNNIYNNEINNIAIYWKSLINQLFNNELTIKFGTNRNINISIQLLPQGNCTCCFKVKINIININLTTVNNVRQNNKLIFNLFIKASLYKLWPELDASIYSFKFLNTNPSMNEYKTNVKRLIHQLHNPFQKYNNQILKKWSNYFVEQVHVNERTINNSNINNIRIDITNLRSQIMSIRQLNLQHSNQIEQLNNQYQRQIQQLRQIHDREYSQLVNVQQNQQQQQHNQQQQPNQQQQQPNHTRASNQFTQRLLQNIRNSNTIRNLRRNGNSNTNRNSSRTRTQIGLPQYNNSNNSNNNEMISAAVALLRFK